MTYRNYFDELLPICSSNSHLWIAKSVHATSTEVVGLDFSSKAFHTVKLYNMKTLTSNKFPAAEFHTRTLISSDEDTVFVKGAVRILWQYYFLNE